ncbi:MAG: Mur ligase family protein [Bacteroidota bacterium]|nr:Mur ligase family protein [Bacteroidota bacterium]
MKVHFIAIGGSAMHNLAIALYKKGYQITGSDDEIFEPSKSRLAKYGLLPDSSGWDAGRITSDLDAVILGMHARADNPELLKAKEMGLKIFSYPEYLYEQSKNKKRIVIGGSHGKTTITAMILHVLNHCRIDCDYMVGAQLDGFDVMVKLSDNAPYMILEGDEYLTSPIDPRPKFHLYFPDIALLSGIAWDHINVFPTFEKYTEQFARFIDLITPKGTLIYCNEDKELAKICPEARADIHQIPYSFPEYYIKDGITRVIHEGQEYTLKVFGKHNLLNLNGARMVCRELGVSDSDFFSSVQSFSGASKRLELIASGCNTSIYKDFAHSPSKLKATIGAVREQFPGHKLFACMELHTFSSLSKEFFSHYAGSMNEADVSIVFFNPHALQLKKLPPVTSEEIRNGFQNDKIEIINDSTLLRDRILREDPRNTIFLLMSSGDFNGLDLSGLADEILKEL